MDDSTPIKSFSQLPEPALTLAQVGDEVSMVSPQDMSLGKIIKVNEGQYWIRLYDFYEGATGKKFKTIMRKRNEFTLTKEL